MFWYYTTDYQYIPALLVKGQIGHKQVFYYYKNKKPLPGTHPTIKQYRRKWIYPPYSRTPDQDRRRLLFKFAVKYWHDLGKPESDPWGKPKPKYKVMTGFNWFISEYLKKTS